MTKKLFPLLFLFLALSYISAAQKLDKPALDSLLNKLADQHKTIGSLTIAKDGNIIYQHATGCVWITGDIEILADVKSKYKIGSITKMFTAVIIFQLIEEGKLSLDTKLSTFYPELPNAPKITISNMLNHRSGLHDFSNDSLYNQYSNKPQTHEQMLTIFASQKPDFEPNTKADYSSTNFVLLGYIIENITKRPYPEELKTRIISKLGLMDTECGVASKTGNVSNPFSRAVPYAYKNGWSKLPETNIDIFGGAGAIVSTPTDLVKFASAFFGGKLISAEHLKTMETLKDWFGMAMFEMDFKGKKGFGHEGQLDGFNSILTYFPKEKLAIAYCSNGGDYMPPKVKEDVLKVLFNK
ncbi:MAG TPA: serine hydrolase domain-containing protein [Mucilaginibacter sp.]|nr:serine hydrolase domain-containing protein [Mucilaginibacter sp.]